MKTMRILGGRGRITIPLAIRMQMGFARGDVLSFTPSDDGKTVLVKREDLCTCDGSRQTESVSLLEFLTELNESQRLAALVHLSKLVAEKKGDA